MVFSGKVETFMQYVGRQRALFKKELVGLGPCTFALIGLVVAARQERKCGAVDERV
jgi:hypothetical protein